MVHEGNIKTVFESCDMLSNQIILQSNDSSAEQFNYDITEMGPGMFSKNELPMKKVLY